MKVIYETAVYDRTIDGAVYPQHIMGEVPDDWTGSQVADWIKPRIHVSGEFTIHVGTYEGGPVWICWEIP